jgi:hypothetical protein
MMRLNTREVQGAAANWRGGVHTMQVRSRESSAGDADVSWKLNASNFRNLHETSARASSSIDSREPTCLA